MSSYMYISRVRNLCMRLPGQFWFGHTTRCLQLRTKGLIFCRILRQLSLRGGRPNLYSLLLFIFSVFHEHSSDATLEVDRSLRFQLVIVIVVV